MQLSRWLGLSVLLAAAACSARGGTYIGGGGGSDDAATGSDAATGNDVVTPPTDTPATTDATELPDVPQAKDVVVPIDMPAGPRCGDGTCNSGESCSNCAQDCGACPPPPDVPMGPRCGDGTCNSGENCSNCMQDCGACMMTGSVTDPCPSTAAQGPNRNCGWRPGVLLSCSPGRATMIGCTNGEGMGSLCQPSYGTCVGDPVMRVCPGTTPCRSTEALTPQAGSTDDACGTCPSAYFTCPSTGQLYVMTGDYDSNNMAQRGTCAPVAR